MGFYLFQSPRFLSLRRCCVFFSTCVMRISRGGRERVVNPAGVISRTNRHWSRAIRVRSALCETRHSAPPCRIHRLRKCMLIPPSGIRRRKLQPNSVLISFLCCSVHTMLPSDTSLRRLYRFWTETEASRYREQLLLRWPYFETEYWRIGALESV